MFGRVAGGRCPKGKVVTSETPRGDVPTNPGQELVVLLDTARQPVGTAPKSEVHTADTPLHLAFSCYVLDGEGRLLFTRRALGKKTWPGVWTNSLCGHPAPEEHFESAIERRARFELGMELHDITLVLGDFSYRAVDSSGVVENEFCPVYVARAASTPEPRASEVEEFCWTPAPRAVDAVRAVPAAFSPWMGEQLAQDALVQALRDSTNALGSGTIPRS